jgi:hypothetical protein
LKILATTAFAAATLATSAASAGLITTPSKPVFDTIAANLALQVSEETFDGVSGFAESPVTGSVGGVTWTAFASGGFYSEDGVFSTNNPGNSIQFTFSEPVNALAGTFFATSTGFTPIPAILVAILSDGTTWANLTGPAEPYGNFIGFVSPTGATISSITLNFSPTTAYASVGSLWIGVVPAPGSVALLGAAALIGVRRRRA